jgi:hypothetical protein
MSDLKDKLNEVSGGAEFVRADFGIAAHIDLKIVDRLTTRRRKT